MFINYTYKNTDQDDQLEDVASKELSRLSHQFEFITKATVLFEEIDADGKDKICKVTLASPGDPIEISETANAFRHAIVAVAHKLMDILKERNDAIEGEA
ncbi:HPF/RaiA family ribosome-associated protein [Sungkyunkwania multivorans]|uniref:HPF/RaiA family ribosome-associated protein n=1 Tax=Sungkyunkwania multivorans TaxID=1173618 RepID=A0ABW3CS73_9FLAO